MENMDVVCLDDCGTTDFMKVGRREIPTLESNQVLIKVIATTVTIYDIRRRKDKMQNDPPDTHSLMGMECSGEILAVGDSVGNQCVGDKVCALLYGGGYAEYVAVDSWRVLPLPKGIRVDEAATLPHATAVAWHCLFRIGKLQDTCSVLVHGGAGDCGQMAIQLALLHGCTVFASFASSSTKGREFCRDLGADCINYDEDFVDRVLEKTKGRGVDLIFDDWGYRVPDNLKILARRGTLILSGFYDVRGVPLDLGLLESNQIKVACFVLQNASLEEQSKILEEIVTNVWPSFESGKLVPKVTSRRYQFSEASAAHAAFEQDFGDRILLVPNKAPQTLKRKAPFFGFFK